MNIEFLNDKLNQLEDTARDLFDKLDKISNFIRQLEKKLQELKAHFPYSETIKTEKESLLRDPEERHESFFDCKYGYVTQIRWCFVWEKDNNSDKFRLFLVQEEQEFVIGGGYPDPEDRYKTLFSSEVLFRKPFIETSLELRMKYAECLADFIRGFTADLEASSGLISCSWSEIKSDSL